MYENTTTTPEFRVAAEMSYDGDPAIRTRVVPRWRHTPTDVQEYLQSMGWTSYSASDGDWMYARADIGAGRFMTWEQAVTYCLVKPFLTEVNK